MDWTGFGKKLSWVDIGVIPALEWGNG